MKLAKVGGGDEESASILFRRLFTANRYMIKRRKTITTVNRYILPFLLPVVLFLRV